MNKHVHLNPYLLTQQKIGEWLPFKKVFHFLVRMAVLKNVLGEWIVTRLIITKANFYVS
jgi:hypothetical protein